MLTFFSKQLGGLLPTFAAMGMVCASAAIVALASVFIRGKPMAPPVAPDS